MKNEIKKKYWRKEIKAKRKPDTRNKLSDVIY